MFDELLERIKRVDEIVEGVEFVKELSPIPSVFDYKVYVDGKTAGRYTIEPRKTSVHIIGASIDPEFRGQNITKQFIDFIITRHHPNYLTTSSQQSAISFWEKMGFEQLRKEEYGGTYMRMWT